MGDRRSSVLLVLLVAAAAAGHAAEPAGEGSRSARGSISDEAARLWTVRMANDAFAFVDRDRDYTAGLAFALNGEQARDHWLSPLRLLDWADGATGFSTARRGSRPRAEGFELGLLLFTPQDLTAEQPLYDDRPYANLLYAAASKLTLDETRGAAFQSSLSFGFLGLPAAEQVHIAIHELNGSKRPSGYDHQISEGGEPTFMYAASHYRLLASGMVGERRPYSVRAGVGGSIGYITEANAEIAFRTDAPWWESALAAANYAGHPQISDPASANRAPGIQFEAGARIHARVFNAFLEGQVRHSDVTFKSSELEPVLVHLWLGATTALKNGLSVSYSVHRQTEEIERGRGARSLKWASIGISRRF
jgi:hypothetical protein